MVAQLHTILAPCNMGCLLVLIMGGPVFAWAVLAHAGTGAFMPGNCSSSPCGSRRSDVRP